MNNPPYSVSVFFTHEYPVPHYYEQCRYDVESEPSEGDLLEELVGQWKGPGGTHCKIEVLVEKNTYDQDGECEYETLHDRTVEATSLNEAERLIRKELEK
jgi:hypothetical protein